MFFKLQKYYMYVKDWAFYPVFIPRLFLKCSTKNQRKKSWNLVWMKKIQMRLQKIVCPNVPLRLIRIVIFGQRRWAAPHREKIPPHWTNITKKTSIVLVKINFFRIYHWIWSKVEVFFAWEIISYPNFLLKLENCYLKSC